MIQAQGMTSHQSQLWPELESAVLNMHVPEEMERDYSVSKMSRIKVTPEVLQALTNLIGSDESEYSGIETAFWFCEKRSQSPFVYIAENPDGKTIMYEHKRFLHLPPEAVCEGTFLISRALECLLIIEINERYNAANETKRKVVHLD